MPATLPKLSHPWKVEDVSFLRVAGWTQQGRRTERDGGEEKRLGVINGFRDDTPVQQHHLQTTTRHSFSSHYLMGERPVYRPLNVYKQRNLSIFLSKQTPLSNLSSRPDSFSPADLLRLLSAPLRQSAGQSIPSSKLTRPPGLGNCNMLTS